MKRLSIAKAATMANVSRKTVERYIHAGVLSAQKRSKTRVDIDPAELARVFPSLKLDQKTSVASVSQACLNCVESENRIVELSRELKKKDEQVEKLTDSLQGLILQHKSFTQFAESYILQPKSLPASGKNKPGFFARMFK